MQLLIIRMEGLLATGYWWSMVIRISLKGVKFHGLAKKYNFYGN